MQSIHAVDKVVQTDVDITVMKICLQILMMMMMMMMIMMMVVVRVGVQSDGFADDNHTDDEELQLVSN